MNLYKSFDQQFFADLVAKNGVDIKPSDVVITQIKSIVGTTIGETTDCNTQLRLLATEAGRWDGKTPIYYNRYQAKDLKVLLGPTISVAGASTVHELIPIFNARYGTGLTVADFKDGPMDLDSEGNGTVTMVAEPESKEWMGTVTFMVVKGDYSLALQIKKAVLDGLKYPDGTMGSAVPPKFIGEAYSYPMNFSAFYDRFLLVKTGPLLGATTDMSTVVDALNTAEGRIVWMGDNSAMWGLDKAVVLYNGLNTRPEYPTNPRYTHVLVVKLPATNTQFGGNLIMHYADPNADAGV